MSDLSTVGVLIGIAVVGTILMDFEGSMEAFKLLKVELDKLIKEINKI